ncbi:MAG: transposase [Ignavibacteria bacterium]|nr:transposase [Ignavibacteria bacterium]
MLKSDKELYEKIKTVSSIKGVGIMTVTKVVAETAGFALIKNKNQITSYSGYDIIHDESELIKVKPKYQKR